ncbi:hypothetical protein GCM10009565_67550 [Amycolatopsis albidoflavus]
MLYLRVEWIHDLEEEPVVHAVADRPTGYTALGEGEVPPFEEIQALAEFFPRVIDAADFARLWEEALRSCRQ